MTSFEVNLLDNESKSSRSKAVSHRVRKYLSGINVSTGSYIVTRYIRIAYRDA